MERDKKAKTRGFLKKRINWAHFTRRNVGPHDHCEDCSAYKRGADDAMTTPDSYCFLRNRHLEK